MNKLFPAAIASIVGFAAPAMAEDSDGPYIQVGIGAAEGKSDMDFGSWFHEQPSDTQISGTMAAGYAHSFGRFNLGANIAYVLGNQNAGRTVQDYAPNPDEKNDAISVRMKNMWSVNLEPGVRVGSRGLLYGKLSYSWAKGTWRIDRPLFGDTTTGKMNLKGYGLGAGYKHNVAGQLYGFTEVQKTWFNKQDVAVTFDTSTYHDYYDTTSASAIVGIGFRF